MTKDWTVSKVGQRKYTLYSEDSMCKGPGVERDLECLWTCSGPSVCLVPDSAVTGPFLSMATPCF